MPARKPPKPVKSAKKQPPKRRPPPKARAWQPPQEDGALPDVPAVPAAPSADAWKVQLEKILKNVPGYDPWDQASACGAWLDHHAAAAAINWFADHLKHVEGSSAGTPFKLASWQAAIVGNIFGWKVRDEKGRDVRRYRRAFIYVPRGNGKTPLVAGVVLYAFYEDGEAGSQCYLAAGQREQAGFLFRNASGMVRQDEYLNSRVKIYGGDQHRSLVFKDDQLSFCKVIPADAAGQHGGIPHVIAVDELHVQPDRELVDVFETAMAKQVRAQPLLVMVTTADYQRISICNETYEHACRVRDNAGDPLKPGLDPTFLPVIYEIREDEDWEDEKNWHKANPNIGASVRLASLREAYIKAKEQPSFENTFRRLHMNQRTKQDQRLIPMDAWARCGKLHKDFDFGTLKKKKAFLGVDLSSSEDLSSLTLAFPLPEERLAVLTHSFCPAAKVARRAKMKFPYDVWQDTGLITATSGDQIDYSAIQDKIAEWKLEYDIIECGIDPAGATQFTQDLMALYGDEWVVQVPQTHLHIADATKEILRLVKSGKLIHGDNEVLTWAAGNVAGVFKGKIPNAAELADFMDKVPVIPSKRQSGDKIDPFAALVDAVARLLMRAQTAGQSVYDKRRALSI